MMMAQRYPTAYDGILALAPAINWVFLLGTIYWPQEIMNMLDYYPRPCELEYLTAAAIEACDELDGVKDGIISLPDLCNFDPRVLIGEINTCDSEENKVTWQAAAIAAGTWTGFTNQEGGRLWYGLFQDAPLTNLPGLTLADTTCTSEERSSCTGAPFPPGEEWIRLFIEKDPDFDTSNLTYAEFVDVFYRSIEEYSSIINTADPDLSAFRDNGGKLLTWHGMADQLIMPNGTTSYYERVLECDADAAEFYRVFLAPGTLHCAAGVGPYPYDSLDRLVAWVESDEAPDTLIALNRTAAGDDATRPLCPYPKVQTYTGGDPDLLESFTCA